MWSFEEAERGKGDVQMIAYSSVSEVIWLLKDAGIEPVMKLSEMSLNWINFEEKIKIYERSKLMTYSLHRFVAVKLGIVPWILFLAKFLEKY